MLCSLPEAESEHVDEVVILFVFGQCTKGVDLLARGRVTWQVFGL